MLGGFPSLIHRIPVGHPPPNPTPGLSFSQSVVDFHPVPFLEAGQRVQEHPVRPESLSYKSARLCGPQNLWLVSKGSVGQSFLVRTGPTNLSHEPSGKLADGGSTPGANIYRTNLQAWDGGSHFRHTWASPLLGSALYITAFPKS